MWLTEGWSTSRSFLTLLYSSKISKDLPTKAQQEICICIEFPLKVNIQFIYYMNGVDKYLCCVK